jgi:hypothetical protein
MEDLSGSDYTSYRQCNPNPLIKNVRIHRNWSSSIDRKGSRVGIAFEEGQLTERGWFADTDAIESVP